MIGLEPIKSGFAIRRLDHFGIGRDKKFLLQSVLAVPSLSLG